MDDNVFWATCWGIVALVIITIITAVGVNTYISDKRILEMVSGGASPIEARCAIYGERTSNNMCNTYQLTQ